LPTVKRRGRGVDHPAPSSAGVKESVELYVYSPSGLSCHVIRGKLHLYINFRILKGSSKLSIKYLIFAKYRYDKGKRLRWAGHTGSMQQLQNILYKTFLSVGKVKDVTLRGRSRSEDNTKKYLKAT
jgi:hypothetical protein